MKHLKYLSYVVRHRWFVFVECVKLGVIWRGLVHDLSKFLPDEWFPYASYFYDPAPDGGHRPRQKEAFDLAWLKHQHRNPHHWQYWILREDSGAVKVVGPWYAKNQHRIELHEESRDLLHSLMEPDELPPKQKVTVITKARITGASLMPDGSVSVAGQVLESHEEER